MSDYIYVEEKLIDKLEKVGVTNGKVIMLYAKIQALAEERGYTTAGAPYFCRILNITDRQTRRYLSELESAGCITRFEKRNGAHTEARLIYPKLFVTEEDEYDLGQDCPERTEMTNDLGQKLSDPGQKCPKPRTEMSKTPDKNVQNLGQKCHPVIVSNSKYHNSTRGTAGAQRDASLVEVADAPDASLDMVANAPGNSANAARLRLSYSLYNKKDCHRGQSLKFKFIINNHYNPIVINQEFLYQINQVANTSLYIFFPLVVFLFFQIFFHICNIQIVTQSIQNLI